MSIYQGLEVRRRPGPRVGADGSTPHTPQWARGAHAHLPGVMPASGWYLGIGVGFC